MSYSDPAVRARLAEKGINRDKLEEFHAAFRLFDVNNTGLITTESLKYILDEQFGQSYGDDDYAYMLRQFAGSDTDAPVDFETFCKSMASKMNNPAYNEAFADAYDLLLRDTGEEELTADVLREGMTKLGETLTEEEAEEMVKVAAKKNDFVRLMSEGGGVDAGGGGGGAAAPAPSAGAPAPAAAGGRPPRPGGAPGRPPRPGGAARPARPAGAARPARPGGAARPARPARPRG